MMLAALALTSSLIAAGPDPAMPPLTLDAAAHAAVVAAVRARMGASAEVSVESVHRLDAAVAPLDAALDPATVLGLPSRIVFRARIGPRATLAPVGGATVVLRVSVEHVHAVRAIGRGRTIEDGDVVTARHDLPRGALRALPVLADVVGGRAARDLADGACVTAPAVAPQPLVRQGAELTGLLQSGGIEVRVRLVAMDSGRAGSRIRVMNPDSRRMLKARIVSRDLVEIQP